MKNEEVELQSCNKFVGFTRENCSAYQIVVREK